MVLNDSAKEEFEIILELILQLEADNQTKFVNGQSIKFGITQENYESYLSDRLKKEGWQQANKVELLTRNESYDYYLYQYKRYNSEKIANPNLRYIVFDAQLHLGPQTIAQIIQKIVKQENQDVFLGKQTLSLMNSMNQKELLQTFILEIKKQLIKSLSKEGKISYEKRLDKMEKQIQGDGVIKNAQKAIHKLKAQANLQLENIEKLQKIKGFDKKSMQFILDEKENILISDLATVLSVFYNTQLKDEQRGICFSLDPILAQNKQQFTEQEKVCWPDKLVNKPIIGDTEFAKILFESDYLLKQMSLGVDKDGKSPFKFPEELLQLGLKPCIKFAQETHQQMQLLCRFWLVPETCNFTNIDENQIFIINDITVACQARQIERVDNKFIDKINQDPEDYAYKFAKKFTDLYDTIANYYPILNRLKQLFKAMALGKWIYQNQIKMDYNQIQKYCKKVSNAPKVIPVVKYEEKLEEEKIPINHTLQEKEEKAKQYLIEKGHPTTQEYIDQVVKQIPDLKGYQIRQQVYFTQGGIDPNCRNMIESKIENEKPRDLVDVPFFPNIKCKDCTRWVEQSLVSLDQQKCSIHNEYTCYLCLELITQHEKEPKCCVIKKYKYLFHKVCFDEFEEYINK